MLIWLANVYGCSAVSSDKAESAKDIAVLEYHSEYSDKLPRLDCTKLALLPLCFLVFCVNSAHLQKGRIVFSQGCPQAHNSSFDQKLAELGFVFN